ncbi:MAG: hypothetical protein V4629_08000 [Pseudomonadota bacterium]
MQSASDQQRLNSSPFIFPFNQTSSVSSSPRSPSVSLPNPISPCITSSSMRSPASAISKKTSKITIYETDLDWSLRQSEVQQYHNAKNTPANKEVLNSPIEKTQCRLKQLRSDLAHTIDPMRIQKIEQRIERLALRLSQLKWLLNQERFTVIGLDGWGEGCTVYEDGNELSPQQLKHGQVLGEYDAVVCKINEDVKVFRLNGTIPLQEQIQQQIKYQDVVPHAFYLHSSQFIEQHKQLTSLSFSEIEKISGALLKKSGWFGKKELWVKGTEKVSGAPIDGFDDSAYLASTAVDGVWQPLLYLGVLSFFTPWVVIGEKGLRGEYLENKESRQQLKQELVDLKPELISKLKQALNLKREDIDLDSPAKKAEYITQLKSIVNPSSANGINSLNDEKEKALTTMLHLQGLMTLEDELTENNLDKKESWLAMRGMQGMLASMVAFSSDAVITFITMLAKPGAATVLQVGSHIGNAGLGVMGVAQFLMMLSGGIKAGRGVKEQHAIKSLIKKLQNSKINFNESVFKSIEKNLKNQASVIWKKKIWPGASLSVGQALMCTASALALVTLFSGAAFAWYITIPLLVVGVALTLLSALYLQKKGEALEEDLFAQEEGFTPKALLENTIQNLKEKPGSTVELLTGVKSKIQEDFINAEKRLTKIEESEQKIEAHHSSLVQRLKRKTGYEKLSNVQPIQFSDIQELHVGLNENNKVDSVLNYIRQIGKEDEFVEALFAKRHSDVKNAKKSEPTKIDDLKNYDVFSRIEIPNVRPIESFKLSRPWKIKDTRLMHPSGQIKENHALYQLNEILLSENIDRKDELKQHFYETALETIIDFSKNRVRAQQSARRELLLNMMENDLLTANVLANDSSPSHAANDNAA